MTEQSFVTDGREVAFAYDPNGNITALDVPAASAPAPRHEFAYTPVTLESAYTPPDTDWPGDGLAIPTGYSYNFARELTRIDRPEAGQQVDFDYDGAKGRLDRITLPSAEEVEYSYFASGTDKGKLQSVTTGDATLTFTYDGSLLTAEQWSGGVSGTVTHGYDDRFQVRSLQVNALAEVEFDYDRDGLMTQAGNLILTRDAETGFLNATAVPASSPEVTDSTGYSAFAELASYTATYSGGTYSYTIDSRDKLGRITEKSETIGGVTTVYEYAYDAAGRLEEVTVDAIVAATYHYDANGNRTAHDGAGGTPIATAQYDAQDRLREYGTTVYEYTESGELQSKTDGTDTTTYTYDALGNLRHVEGPGGTPEIEYLVDGRNRRIGKKLNGVLVKRWLYQDQLNPIAEIDAAGNVAQFVYGSKGNVPDYMVRYDSGGIEIGTYRILSDHLGSVRLVIDISDGTIMQRIDYDEFGVVLSDTSPGFQAFGFAGGIWDADTGLVRFGARDYDPIIGRWTAKDPIRFGGGDTNLYGYALNNPINLIDPLGLASGDWWDPRTPFNYWAQAAGGAKDFATTYRELRRANREFNLIGSDKYYHCLANCRASKRGLGGQDAAVAISETRELWDEHVKGYPREDCDADRAANAQGRDPSGGSDCVTRCLNLKPAGLPLP